MLQKLIIVSLFLIIVKCDGRGPRVRRIVGGGPAPVPPEDDPIVYTRFAGKSAKVLGVRDFPQYVFKGIRYAQPPIKKNRFLRPLQYFLNGLENATAYPPPCVQPLPGQNKIVGSEDCLFLNIFTPTLPTGMEGLPVVVWIHGGGFRYGSASQYGVRHLVGKQIIIVTVQYRLGSLGFLSSNSKELPGNAALWDMMLAVQWTRNYIGFFGGNPHRIVVMGHGTGASSAMLVALGNAAKGLTSGVIAMSGSSISNFATDDSPANTAKEVADMNDCPTTSILTMVKCLQNLSPAAVIRGDSQIEFQRIQNRGFVSGMSGKTGSAPVVEGLHDHRSLPGLIEYDPINYLSSQKYPKIPLLTGITKDETKKACQGQFKNEIINKLKTIPNFLDQMLVRNLQNLIGFPNKDKNNSNNTDALLNTLDPLQFRNYVQVKNNDINEGLAKISEVTSDVVFNVPAFLTADLWTKRNAPAFLYRFEHSGKKKKGNFFLRGLPLIGNSTKGNEETNAVGHGDELSYLFDVQDLNGHSLDSSSEINEDDAKVRDIFTQMIADFARFGNVNVNGQTVRPFSSDDNNFIQISPIPKIANNFRYCEMALWCGLAQRLQSATCGFLKVVDSQIRNAQSFVESNLGGLTSSNKSAITGGINGTQKKIENTFQKIMNPLNAMKLPQQPQMNKKINNVFSLGKLL